MPAGRIVLPPYFPVRDGDGYPVSGAELYVYVNETTTLATIYTDFALTLPSANPLSANAAGVFPAVFVEAGTEADPVLYSLAVTDSAGRAPGRPSVFDNYRPSVDYETATLILAEAASESAQNALADIEQILLTQPESVAIAGRALIDGSNIIDPAAFRSSIGTAAPNVVGPAAPVQGSVAKIDYMYGLSAASSGGIHPNGNVYYGWSFNKTFSLAANPTPAAAPAFTMLAYATNSGATGDVGAYMGEVVCTAANTKALGMNLIVGSNGAYAGLKQEGLEIDIQPVAGSTVIDGFGLALNAFNVAMPISGVLFGGVSGGSFANAINIIGGISGSGLVATQNAPMSALVNTGTGVYSTAAIVLSNLHKIRYSGTGSAHGYTWMDGSNNLRFVAGGSGNFIFRDNADVTSLVGITSNGVDVQVAGGSYRVGGVDVVKARDTGWTAATGTPFKGAYASYTSVTITNPPTQAEVQAIANALQNLSQRYVALDAALRAHGLIGA